MIHLELTAAAVARELRAEHERVVLEVASMAAERRVPTDPSLYWAWARTSEIRLLALEAAATAFEAMPPGAVIVAAEQLPEAPTPMSKLRELESLCVSRGAH